MNQKKITIVNIDEWHYALAHAIPSILGVEFTPQDISSYIKAYIDDSLNEILMWSKKTNTWDGLIDSFLDTYFKDQNVDVSRVKDRLNVELDFLHLEIDNHLLRCLNGNLWREVHVYLTHDVLYLEDDGDYRINWYNQHHESK